MRVGEGDSMSGHVNAQVQAQRLLEEVLRLLDEAGLERPAVYAQMALDSLCDAEADDASEATL